MQKQAYVAPALTELGSLEDVTRGASSGARLDAAMPIGTPTAALTFS